MWSGRSYPLAARDMLNFEDLREQRRLVYADQADAHPAGKYLQTTQMWQIFDYGQCADLACCREAAVAQGKLAGGADEVPDADCRYVAGHGLHAALWSISFPSD